ncbi:hypothetical protein [Paenibacillus chitinolyticus]|uniref:hypothetical protein n=1 Tax=Paenibacillus chitinolyticus TaxID=79263 RepID=UPI003CFDCCF1
MEKVKVINLTASQVNINLTEMSNGKVVPIKPHAFALLSADELAYVRNTSAAFDRGTLRVDNMESVPAEIDIPDSPNALTQNDIVALLKKPQKQIQLSIDEIDSVNVIRMILNTAKEQDKPVKVVEAIETRLNELLEA